MPPYSECDYKQHKAYVHSGTSLLVIELWGKNRTLEVKNRIVPFVVWKSIISVLPYDVMQGRYGLRSSCSLIT